MHGSRDWPPLPRPRTKLEVLRGDTQALVFASETACDLIGSGVNKQNAASLGGHDRTHKRFVRRPITIGELIADAYHHLGFEERPNSYLVHFTDISLTQEGRLVWHGDDDTLARVRKTDPRWDSFEGEEECSESIGVEAKYRTLSKLKQGQATRAIIPNFKVNCVETNSAMKMHDGGRRRFWRRTALGSNRVELN
jgi:hypothetical protein